MTNDQYATATHEWVLCMPIGLGLCPWAIKSNNKGLLNIITCTSDTASDVADIVKREIESFANKGTPPLGTTLIVCPCVKEWKDFKAFDEYIKSGIKQQLMNDTVLEDVTLVVFHPKFCRWYGLPPNMGIGSEVQSHVGIIGQKSKQTATATIIETNNKAFGLRKVKVRFHNTAQEDGSSIDRLEQYVPTDWIVIPAEEQQQQCTRPILQDNSMHQSPYPTIHIINNKDLGSLCARDVSRVKRLNSKRMTKLGWAGVEQHLAIGELTTST